MDTRVERKVLLVILDGFGLRDEKDNNAVAGAVMPNWDKLTKKYAFGAIDASSEAVGLPGGQFGNSEVGHLNIGAGRVVQQDITKIDSAIANGSFYTNPVFVDGLNTTSSGVLHVLGLLSDGGVHSHIEHIFALIRLAEQNPQIKHVWVHAFLDGRDTPPKSAAKYLEQLQNVLNNSSKTKVATLIGRYYAMDRDKRYERVKLAYDAIMSGMSEFHGNNMQVVLQEEYKSGHNDEFVRPYVMFGYSGVNDGDSIIFANFRSDRAIQLTDAIITHKFEQFTRPDIKLSNFISMTSYDSKFAIKIAYPPNFIKNTLGEYIAGLGLHQLRIAETEKYPHVTFFFNGGRKEPYTNEDRILVDSPRDVATYDLKPEMSLPEVTDKLVAAIKSQKYDFIITNFANGDMVGHSGILSAAIKAVEALDKALGAVVDAMQSIGGEVLVIADHGNCEEMFDYVSNQPHTQHTTNLVPCLYIGRNAVIKPKGALKDVAPTLLFMSGLKQPLEMTGHNLIQVVDN
jgi:2,3-bisphosphoglycerate-independent phosphoglycerate mutase